MATKVELKFDDVVAALFARFVESGDSLDYTKIEEMTGNEKGKSFPRPTPKLRPTDDLEDVLAGVREFVEKLHIPVETVASAIDAGMAQLYRAKCLAYAEKQWGNVAEEAVKKNNALMAKLREYKLAHPEFDIAGLEE